MRMGLIATEGEGLILAMSSSNCRKKFALFVTISLIDTFYQCQYCPGVLWSQTVSPEMTICTP